MKLFIYQCVHIFRVTEYYIHTHLQSSDKVLPCDHGKGVNRLLIGANGLFTFSPRIRSSRAIMGREAPSGTGHVYGFLYLKRVN